MKVNLFGPLRNGYINVVNGFDPNPLEPLPENTKLVNGSPAELDKFLNGELAEEIIFNPPLNVLLPNDIIKIFLHWKEKLAANGTIVINFFDVKKASNLIYNEKINLESVHQLILGKNNEYKSVLDFATIKELFLKLGLKLKSVSQSDVSFHIEVSR